MNSPVRWLWLPLGTAMLAGCAGSVTPTIPPGTPGPTPVVDLQVVPVPTDASVSPAAVPTALCSNDAEFLEDLTLPDGTLVLPGAALESAFIYVIGGATAGGDPSWFGFPITLREAAGVARVDLLRYLDQYRIGTRLLFAGNLVRQPYMAGRQYRVSGELSQTDRVMRDTFWIGLYPALTDEMLEFTAEKIGAFLGISL